MRKAINNSDCRKELLPLKGRRGKDMKSKNDNLEMNFNMQRN